MDRKLPVFRAWDRVRAKGSPWKGSVQHVALALALHADKETGEAWPSVAKVVEETGLSDRTVRRALDVLCDGPVPLLWRRWRGKGRRSRVYGLVSDPAAFTAARDAARAKLSGHGDRLTQGEQRDGRDGNGDAPERMLSGHHDHLTQGAHRGGESYPVTTTKLSGHHGPLTPQRT